MGKKILLIAVILVVGLVGIWANGGQQAAGGRVWPTVRNVEMQTYAGVGSGVDAIGRLVNAYLSKKADTNVYMTNDGSGGGTVSYEKVRNGPKDGSLLLWVNYNIIFQYFSGVYNRQVLEDFTLISVFRTLLEQPMFVVKADSKYKTFKDLLDDAKARPNMVSLPTGPMGRYYAAIVAIEKNVGATFRKVDGADLTERVASVLGGITDFMVTVPTQVEQYVQNGDMRFLAYYWNEPRASTPDVPTMKDFGITAHEENTDGYYMLLGPKGMDEKVADAIAEYLNGIQDDEATIAALKNIDGSTPVYIPRSEGRAQVQAVADFARSVMGNN